MNINHQRKAVPRYLQLRLLTLFAIVCVASVAFALLRVGISSVNEQRLAMSHLQLRGVMFIETSRSPSAFDRVLAVLGYVRPHPVEALFPKDASISAADCEHLLQLPTLHRIDMSDTQCDDRVLPKIARMEGLRVLDLYNSQVSDRGVGELRARKPNLTVNWAIVIRRKR